MVTPTLHAYDAATVYSYEEAEAIACDYDYRHLCGRTGYDPQRSYHIADAPYDPLHPRLERYVIQVCDDEMNVVGYL